MNNYGAQAALVASAVMASSTPVWNSHPNRSMSETKFRHQFHLKAGLSKRKAARKQARASRKKNRAR